MVGCCATDSAPLLPRGHGAEVDQLVPASGGVVALISDISTFATAPGSPVAVSAPGSG
jgi:hypothetical protein